MNKKDSNFKIQKISDILAISLSGICAVHCLITPLLLILFPILGSSFLSDELFHKLILFLIIPTSGLAFFLGCKNHRDIYTIIIGIVGFAIICYGGFWGHDTFGEFGEKLLTVVGGLIMCIAHIRNYKMCHNDTCHDH